MTITHTIDVSLRTPGHVQGPLNLKCTDSDVTIEFEDHHGVTRTLCITYAEAIAIGSKSSAAFTSIDHATTLLGEV